MIVVVLGSALIDVARGERRPGGAALNVAIDLVRLGGEAVLVAPVSRDPAGVELAAWLTENGVALVRAHGPHHETVVAEAISVGGTVRYRFSSDIPSGCLGVDGRVLDLVRGAEAVALSALRFRTTSDRDALITALASVPTVYDPNPRARDAEDARAHRADVEALAPVCDLLKIGEDDLGILWPGVKPEHVIARLRDLGARAVLVTLGRDGARLHADNTRMTVPAHRAVGSEIYPVGAGDATTAAMTRWMTVRDLGTPAIMRAALDDAMAVAALVCRHESSTLEPDDDHDLASVRSAGILGHHGLR